MKEPMQPNYDVLVIGRGIAGLTAALHAAGRGASVAVVYHNNICSTNLAYEGVFRFPQDIDELETMVHDHGCGLADPQLLSTFFQHYRDYGQKDLERIFPLASAKPIGKKHKRGGPGILADLNQSCNREDITFINGMAVKIITSGRAVSAVQIYHLTHLITIKVKSIIIAAGGGIGSIYQTTNNAPSCCLPGTVLALNAGARLKDLEFISHHPFGAVNYRTRDNTTPVFTFFNIGINTAIYSNKTNNRVPFIENLISTRTVAQNPHDNIFKIAREVQKNNGIHIYKTVHGHSKRISLAVVAHSLIDGIEVDTDFMTAVTGLYAVGESAGGLNGAGRLPGMALLEGYVAGKQAGLHAAGYASKHNYRPVNPAELHASSTRFGMFSNVTGEIKNIADTAIFIERTETDLRLAEKRLAKLMSGIVREDLAQHIEYALAETVLAMIHASLLRKESRGNFYRKDYPHPDLNMQHNIIVQKKNPDAAVSVFRQHPPNDSLACGNDA